MTNVRTDIGRLSLSELDRPGFQRDPGCHATKALRVTIATRKRRLYVRILQTSQLVNPGQTESRLDPEEWGIPFKALAIGTTTTTNPNSNERDLRAQLFSKPSLFSI